MNNKNISVLTRRDFIRRAACAAVGTAAMTSAIRDLRFMNAAVAQSNITDYKALVCIFLQGGNDSNNLIIPTIQSQYNNYAAIRTPVLAIPQSAILPVTSLDPRRQHLRPASELSRTADAFRRRQAGVFVQHRHAGLSDHPRAISCRDDRHAAATFFPRRPADAMADLHSRPAADHRLGRALRGFAQLRPAQRADFADGHAGGREHV